MVQCDRLGTTGLYIVKEKGYGDIMGVCWVLDSENLNVKWKNIIVFYPVVCAVLYCQLKNRW